MIKTLIAFILTSFFSAASFTHTIGTPPPVKRISLEAPLFAVGEGLKPSPTGGKPAAFAQAEGDELGQGIIYQNSDFPQLINGQKSFDGQLTARAALVMDVKSGLVFYDLSTDDVLPFASLTKLATALVFLKYHPGWDKIVPLIDADARDGNVAFIKIGEEVSTLDLFYAGLVGSDNTAAMALARSTGLSEEEFVAEMNNLADSLGLKQTSFVEPTGLNINNRSTAGELARLAHRAFRDPEIKRALATPYYQIKTRNTNRVVGIPSTNYLLTGAVKPSRLGYKILGGKTGYLKDAGYNFVTLTADQRGHELLTIILGAESLYDRFTESQALIDWVYTSYEWPIDQ